MASFKIHDVEYEIPESFTLKEMRIIERYAAGHMDSGFEVSKLCGVIHVAIARVKPDTPFEEIQDVIDNLPADDLEEVFNAAAGQSPPAESSSEKPESLNGDSSPSSDAVPESETPENSGSQVSEGFRSFHAMSGN